MLRPALLTTAKKAKQFKYLSIDGHIKNMVNTYHGILHSHTHKKMKCMLQHVQTGKQKNSDKHHTLHNFIYVKSPAAANLQ